MQVPYIAPVTTFHLSNGTDVTFDSSVTTIDSEIVAPYKETLTSIYLAPNVTRVDDGAFQDCTLLSSATITNPSMELGDNRCIFALCDNLSDIYYNGTSEDWAYYGYNGNLYNINTSGTQPPFCLREEGSCTIHFTDGIATVHF